MSEEFLVKSEVFMKDGRKLHTAKIEKITLENERVIIQTDSQSFKLSRHTFNDGGLKYLNNLKKGDTIIYAHSCDNHYEGDLGKIALFVPIYNAGIY